MSGHQHREAFCLMRYRSDDGTEEEIISPAVWGLKCIEPEVPS